MFYLMDTEFLEPMRGDDSEGKGHWWRTDNLSQEKYDLTLDQFSTNKEIESVYGTAEARGYYRSDEIPASQFFDLIQKVKPNSK